MVTPSKKRKAGFTRLNDVANRKKLSRSGAFVPQAAKDQSSTPSAITASPPCPLMNEGVNVCFINAVVQFLYTVAEIQQYFDDLEPNNNVASEMKCLFTELKSRNTVQT